MSPVDAGRLAQEDVLLLIADGATGTFDLDQIRLMKGAFLVSQRGRPQWKSLFDFRPYGYGPFDSSVYRARDALIANGLLRATQPSRYHRYELTDAGDARVDELDHALGGDADWFRQIGRYVTTRSFSRLLDEIYAEFPLYAKRSVVLQNR
jgi:hypothetical protein